MAFRRTQKITRDCKITYEVYFDALVGFPTDPPRGGYGAPEFFVEFERGTSLNGKSKPVGAVVDAARAQDLLPYGLGDCPPTVTKIEHLVTFNSTVQRKNDFNYKPKTLTLRVVDAEFGTGVIGGEVDLAKWVDHEMLSQRTFEMMNPSKNKCLLVTIKGYPTLSKAEEKQKSKGATKEEQSNESQATGSTRNGSPAGGRGGRRRAAKEESDDEFDDLLDSQAATNKKDTPRGRGRPGSPSPNPSPPPQSRQRVNDKRAPEEEDTERKENPPSGSLLVGSKKGNKRKEQSAPATMSANEGQREEEAAPVSEEDSDGAPLKASTMKRPERGDHNVQKQQVIVHTGRGKATRTPTPPVQTPVTESDDDNDDAEPAPCVTGQRRGELEAASSKKSKAAGSGGLEPLTADDYALKERSIKRGSLRPQPHQLPQTVARSDPGFQQLQEDKAARLVGRWIKDIRSAALLDIDDSFAKHSKRQSLSMEERQAPLPPATSMIMESLYVARVPNGELAFFVGDFIGQLLYTEVVANTRHYGMWVRVLLHVIEEMLVYYFPTKEDMPEGSILDEIQGEQEFFVRMMESVVKTKNKKFTDTQQAQGVHVDHILDDALNRDTMGKSGAAANNNNNNRQSRWEVEETNEDREDRVYLHAFVLVECGCVLEQLTLLAADRVMGLLHRPVDNFSFKAKNRQQRLLPPGHGGMTAGGGHDDMEDAGRTGTTNFIFSVTQQRSRHVAGGGGDGSTGKPQMFTTELGASGWLPSLIQELDTLFLALATPKPVQVGTTADAAIKSRGAKAMKATLRTKTMLVEIFRPIFYNVQCTLINLMHRHRKEVAPTTAAAAVEEKKGRWARRNEKRNDSHQEEQVAPPTCCEEMQLRTAKDAMNLKLTVSALEQWLNDHNLYQEIRHHLLPLRQICDLFILSKSIFTHTQTRLDVCGLVSEELTFHGLLNFQTDDRELIPDAVPVTLLESLASSIGLRHGLKKATGQSTEAFITYVASEVPIPVNQMIPVDFALLHIDKLVARQRQRAGEEEGEKEVSAAIRDSLEWDARSMM